jgi:hypothetical protein
VVNVRCVAKVKAGVPHADLYRTSETFNMSEDVVKVAHLNANEKMSPFVRCERTDRDFCITCVANQDKFAPTCLAALAARDDALEPVDPDAR